MQHEENIDFARSDSAPYNKLFIVTVVLTSIVAIAPLITMAIVNIYQYQKAFKADMINPLTNQTTNTRNSLESFIDERYAALKFISKQETFEEISNQSNLSAILRHLKDSFDGYIDLGVVNSDGDQISYVGPYNLLGKNYSQQIWFNEAAIKGDYISDVFMGYRDLPHFTIAIVKDLPNNDFYILRATINSEKLYSIIMAQKLLPSNDVFLINKTGLLQTPSKYNGEILRKWEFPVPAYSSQTEVVEKMDGDANYFLAYSYINNSPFILIETTKSETVMSNWISTRNNLIIFLIVSIAVIVIVIVWGSYRMIKYIKRYEYKMISFLRNVSYTNKLASIGRLAAGVSHEINNPLSIINENAGVIQDILRFSEHFPAKEKILSHTKSIVKSVDRCSRITHRLLGFAKRMDAHIESVDIEAMMNEVIGFVNRDLQNRNIKVNVDSTADAPIIQSDKGQLQQVFLNIVNNAIDAVEDGGQINISISRDDNDKVKVKIKDNGVGISKADLEKIFDPFYSSKKEHGTGLGLFITYGIVQKLGGTIEADSMLGKGSTFIITLPSNFAINKD